MNQNTMVPTCMRECLAFTLGHRDLLRNVTAYASLNRLAVSVLTHSHRRLDTRSLVADFERLGFTRPMIIQADAFQDAEAADYLLREDSEGRASFVVVIHRYREVVCIEVYPDGSEPEGYASNITADAVSASSAMPDPHTSFQILTSSGGHLSISPIRMPSRPLEGAEALYPGGEHDVVRKFGDAVLAGDRRRGSMLALTGLPGTGKTSLVMGLAEYVQRKSEDVQVIVVGQDMMRQITGPTVVPLLLNNRDPDKVHPTVLVIEDAESALEAKGADNVDVVSTLLNVSDGVFGAGLNCWVVITSNGSIKKTHPLCRPGRMFAHLDVGDMGASHANKLWQHLYRQQSMGSAAVKDRYGNGRHTLASVYADFLAYVEAE